MKLLMLIHRLPLPPDRGAKLRAAAELRWLSARHEVWCAGFQEVSGGCDDLGARDARGGSGCGRLGGLIRIPLRRSRSLVMAGLSLAAGRTATAGYFASRRLEQQVRAWAGQVGFDAVLAFSSSMAPLALRVPAARRVLDMVDLDSGKWADLAERAAWPMRAIYKTEAIRLARRERQWLQRFDATVLVNAREARLLGDDADRDRLHVIPIEAGLLDEEGSDEEGSDEPNVGLVGAMDYPPNVEAVEWFGREIWPRILARRPDARWWIIGRSPSRSVRRWHDGRRVHVTGTVTAVGPYLRQMRVHVAPLRLARGVQNKVLAAMVAGRPCVVTSQVAEGIGARAGRELLVADQAEGFADAVVSLLEDRRRAEDIAEAGRRFVREHFRPEVGLRRLEDLLLGRNEPGRREDPCSCPAQGEEIALVAAAGVAE